VSRMETKPSECWESSAATAWTTWARRSASSCWVELSGAVTSGLLRRRGAVRQGVDPQPPVVLGTDPPLAVGALPVGLVVVAVALEGDAVGDVDVVEHRPDGFGLGVAQQADLGHVAVVDRHGVGQDG